MKIRVTIKDYEYQGLKEGSVHENVRAVIIGQKIVVTFTANGKEWYLVPPMYEIVEEDGEEVFPSPNEKLLDVINTDLKREECRGPYCECEKDKCSVGKVDMRGTVAEVKPIPSSTLTTKPVKEQGPIKSDGGSSTYYDLPVAEWLLYTLNERQKEGKCYIKTEEMISVFFGNDFSFGTLFKSLVRAWGIKKGAGKAGNDMKYETGKIRYYADKILEQNEEKK